MVSLNFLIKIRDEILDNLLENFSSIFNEGTNLEPQKADYERLFVSLIRLFQRETSSFHWTAKTPLRHVRFSSTGSFLLMRPKRPWTPQTSCWGKLPRTSSRPGTFSSS